MQKRISISTSQDVLDAIDQVLAPLKAQEPNAKWSRSRWITRILEKQLKIPKDRRTA